MAKFWEKGSWLSARLSDVGQFFTRDVFGYETISERLEEMRQNVAKGVLVNRAGATEQLPVVYGKRRLGGIKVFAATTGSNNEYLHIVYAICEGQVSNSGLRLFVNDEYVSINTFSGDVDDVSSPYYGLLRAKFHTGTDSQAADSDLVAEVDEWTTAHKLSGVCYCYIRFKWDNNNRAFGGMPRVHFQIDGKQVYDPRTSSTAYSNNPALCIYDYLTNTRYGRGLATSAIDIDSIIAAANYCDEQVTPFSGATWTHNRYECDTVIDTDRTIVENLRILLQSCRGYLPFVAGQFQLILDKPETPSFTFDQSNILGALNIDNSGRRTRYNRVTVTFTDAAQKRNGNGTYSDTSESFRENISVTESSSFLAEDNGLRLEKELRLDSVTNGYRAFAHAEMVMRQSRKGITVSFAATLEAFSVSVGQVVLVTHPTPGWTDKPFRCASITLHDDATLSVVLTEYDSAVYNLALPSEAVSATDTSLPNPNIVLAPTNIGVASGDAQLLLGSDGTIITRAKVTWTPSADAYVSSYDVEFKKSADTEWIPAASPKGQAASEIYIVGVTDGVAYDFRVRARNTNDAVSSWITQSNHTVIGKTARPGDVTTFSVTELANGTRQLDWTLTSPPADLAGYEIRYSSDTGAGWATMTPLHEGLLTSSPLETNSPAAGTWKFAIVAVDTTGNISANMRTVTVTLGAPPDMRLVVGNMLVNGSGEYGDNTGWSVWTFESDGSFSYTSNSGTLFSDYPVPVDVESDYRIAAGFKADQAISILSGFDCLDANKEHINYWECWRDTNKNTTLYAPTSTSSTTVDIVPAQEAWFVVTSPYSYIQFDIQSDGSDLPQKQARKILSIDTTDPNFWRLTLESPPDAVYPAGTAVGNATSGGNYNYCLASSADTTWTRSESRISGVNAINEPPPNTKFRIGTKFVRALVLPNRSGVTSTTYVRNYFLAPVTPEPLLDALSLINGPADPAATAGATWGADIVNEPTKLGDINQAEGTKLLSVDVSFSDYFDTSDSLSLWESYRGSGERSIVQVADSVSGGKIMRVGNNSGNDEAWMLHSGIIPFDPNKLYRLRVRVRRTAGSGTFYFGWAGVAADGTTLVNTLGADQYSSQHYHGATGYQPGSSWAEYDGYTLGFGSGGGTLNVGTLASPGKMHPDVRYLRPLLLVNYSAAAGIYEVDAVTISAIDYADALAYSDGTLIESLKPAQAGADVTAANTAAAIAGQGALATKSSVDMATSDVVNKSADNIAETTNRKWAGESGADKTKTALEATVAITAGGIDIGGTNARIRIGSATDYLAGNGVFAGRVGGISKFHVGDPAAETYLAFDGSDVVLGRQSKFVGVDAINNDTAFYSTYFDSISMFQQATFGGSITQSTTYGTLILSSGSSSGNYARVNRRMDALRASMSFDNGRMFKIEFKYNGSSGTEVLLVCGSTWSGNGGFGFKAVGNTLYGWTYNTSEALTSTSVTLSAGTSYVLSAIMESGTVKFYVDGSLVGSTSAQLPVDGPNNPLFVFGAQITNSSNSGSIDLGHLTFVQF